MQTRVVELIPQLLDEGFIEELLVVNDDLNNAFIRYERCGLESNFAGFNFVWTKVFVSRVQCVFF